MTATTRPATTPLKGLFSQVYRDILNNRVILPSMPHVALRLRAAVNQPDFSAEKVARILETDAGASAYLIAIANSALYRGRVPITKVQTAVSRLGMASTRNLVMSYALRAMFTTRSRSLAKLLQQTWRTSAHLAALSSVIAQRVGHEPDEAMLAGLLQDIGALPLLRGLDQRKQAVTDPERILATVESFTGKTGPVLLRHWGFEPTLIDAVRSRKDWLRDPAPEADLGDIVLLARLHAGVGTPEQAEQPHINAVPAYAKLFNEALGPDESLAILQEAESDVRDIMLILGVS
ncbi:MAG: HDOD domain-containing protein [Pseudomonadota bacterium]